MCTRDYTLGTVHHTPPASKARKVRVRGRVDALPVQRHCEGGSRGISGEGIEEYYSVIVMFQLPEVWRTKSIRV